MGTWNIQVQRKSKAVRLSAKRIESLVRFVAKREKHPPVDLEVVVVARREMAKINRDYLSHAGPTDVISFDLTDMHNTQPSWLIVVCDDVAISEAPKEGLSPTAELLLYIIHGLLHQMGYDDKYPEKAPTMVARQGKLLTDFLKK